MATQPLYKTVRDQIVNGLVRQEWRAGESMPSERELAERYSVGISKIRAAISELVAANVLIRMQGKGTYIAHHSTPENLYRFFNVVRNDGTKEPFYRELVWLKKQKSDAKVDVTLQLSMEKRAFDVFKARLKLQARKATFAVVDIVVPCRLFPQLDSNGVPDGVGSLYSIYQSTYGVNIIKVVEQLFAVRSPAWVARALEIPLGEPVLEIRRLAYTFNNVPVEVRSTWVHTERHHYLIAQGAAG